MPIAEPKNLLEVLSRLDDRVKGDAERSHRRFERFAVRAEAKLEPIDPDGVYRVPIRAHLRDISRAGIGFLVEANLEPCSLWRAHILVDGLTAGVQPLIVRYCRPIQEGLYLAGGQFVIEPYLMSLLGVPQEHLTSERMCRYDPHDVCEFVAPECIEAN